MAQYHRTDIISTASKYFRKIDGSGFITSPEDYHKWIILWAQVDPNIFKLPSEVDTTGRVKAKARISGGRWIADCPFGCGNIILIEKNWPFLCNECGNDDGYYRLVAWPNNIEEIETRLMELPVNDRNWSP